MSSSGMGTGQIFGALGSIVGDIFGALGQQQIASMYHKAAEVAGQNVDIAKESGQVQAQQVTIGYEKTLGAQAAAVGASGFAASGSAEDLLRSSSAQGSLAKSLVTQQSLIQQNSFKEQQYAYKAEAASAQMGEYTDIGKGVMDTASMFMQM